MRPQRNWTVLVIGGPAGVGKSTLSRRLAQHFALPLTEIDDLVTMLARMTTPEQQPVLHYWDTHPEVAEWSPTQILALHLDVARLLTPAIHAVIDDHLAFDAPFILEGDYLLPELIAAYPGRVRGLFLYEPEAAQIAQNFAQREPEAGPQEGRAHVSWLYGEWLRAQCAALQMTCMAARPWDAALSRALSLLAA